MRALQHPPGLMPASERVHVALAPGRVRHLGGDSLDALPAAIEAVVEADRVEQVPEGAQVRQHAHRPVRSLARALLDRVQHRRAQRLLGIAEVVRASKPRRRRPAGRPQPAAVQQLRQLVEVQVAHEQPHAQLVLDRLVTAVAQPALVEGARRHAGTSCPSRSAARSAADHPVLVEAEAPVGAAVVGASHAAHLRPALLGGQAGLGVDRVGVLDRAQHPLRVDRAAAVERDAVLVVGAQRLQAVHVVGNRGPPRRLLGQVEVPARPGAATPGQQARVGVQHGLVGLVGDRAQQLVLGLAGIGQHARAPGRSGPRARPRRTPPVRSRARSPRPGPRSARRGRPGTRAGRGPRTGW